MDRFGMRMAPKTTTGLVVRGKEVAWTTLRQGKAGWEIQEQERLPLANAAEAPPAAAEALAAPAIPAAQARELCRRIQGKIALAIPADRAFMRVVILPAVDPRELADMVALQADQFSPFAVEQLVVTHEELSRDEKSVRVLMVVAPQAEVERLGAPFIAAGRIPTRVDVDVLGWWQCLQACAVLPQEGRHLALLLDGDGAELVVTENGLPLLFRSLGARQGLAADEYFTELGHEIAYTLAALEAEWGAQAAPSLTIWREAPELAEAPASEPPEQAIARAAGLPPATVHTLAEIPPCSEGLARRAIRIGAAAGDLAPAAWRATAARKALWKTMRRAAAAFAAVWLTVVAVALTVFTVQKNSLQKYRQQVLRLEQPAEEVRRLQVKLASLEELAESSHSALECLREISQPLSEGMLLTSFIFRKGSDLSVRGEADSTEKIYDYQKILQQATNLFVAVKLGPVTTRPNEPNKAQFSLTFVFPGGKP